MRADEVRSLEVPAGRSRGVDWIVPREANGGASCNSRRMFVVWILCLVSEYNLLSIVTGPQFVVKRTHAMQ